MFTFLNRKKEEKKVAPYTGMASAIANSLLQNFGNQSYAPKTTSTQPTGQIQGSGYTSNYASNPSNYQAPKPSGSTPPPSPTQTNTQASFLNSYLQDRAGTATQRIGDVENRAKTQQDLQRELMESRQKTLSNIGNIQGESFNQYANQLRGGVDLQKATAERQKGDVGAEYEDQRYYNEQARKERMKGLESTLASLGTLQSSAMMNVGAKVNMGAERQDREAQRVKNSRIAEIEDGVRMAEYEVEGLIQQEAGRYRQQVEALAGQMDQNSIEFKQAVENIADQANQRIYGILDKFDDFAYSAQMEIIKAEAQGKEELSNKFLYNGTPTTRADYMWLRENPDYEQRLQGQQREIEQAMTGLGLIQDIKSGNVAQVTGSIQGRMPTILQDSTDMVSKINQVKSILELGAAGQLKGQGQVSEGEREILKRAASSLDRVRSEDEFRKALDEAQRAMEIIVYGQSDTAPRLYQNDYSQVNQSLVNQHGG